ncbi:MAG: pyridoxamine 5'-phosphate oxidase family protein [Actinomycetota bacterium]|nr:pyridoxamine 5'-phosphate oxidase family protein [Actinomycetota bacterium]
MVEQPAPTGPEGPTALRWQDVAARLAAARNYWLATVGPDGAPHAVPVWGAVVGDALHLYTQRSTNKAHHVAANPRVAVHLESAEDVLVVHGELEDLGLPARNPAVVAALDAKYTDPDDAAYLPSHDPAYDVIFRLRPARALAWRLADFDNTQARWSAAAR